MDTLIPDRWKDSLGHLPGPRRDRVGVIDPIRVRGASPHLGTTHGA